MASAIAVLSIVPTIAEAKTNMFAFKGLNLERSNADAKSISKTSPSLPTKISFKTLGLKLQTETFGEMALVQSFTAERKEYQKQTSLNLFIQNETKFTPFFTTEYTRNNVLGSRLGFSHDRTSVEGYGMSIGSGLRYEVDDGMYFDGGYRYIQNEDFGLIDNASTDNGHEVRFGFTWELN